MRRTNELDMLLQKLYEDYALGRLPEKRHAKLSAQYEAEQAQKFNSNDYLKLFCHIKENQSLYRTYFKLGYDHQRRIEQYDTKLAEQYFDNRHIAYHMEFFKSGLNAIIKMWLSDGCKETPEEMNEILRREYQGRLLSDRKTT